MTGSRDVNATERIIAAASTLRSEELIRFLATQRWFAGKARSPSTARLSSVIPLPWGNGAYAALRIVVSVDGRDGEYQIPVALSTNAQHGIASRAIIAAPGAERADVIFDAIEDEEFRRGLATALAIGATSEASDGKRWVARRSRSMPFVVLDHMETRVISAEQSNSAFVVNDAAIIKLLRRLSPGIHPEVEVGSFLTERVHLAHTPSLYGTAYFDEGDEQTLAATMTEFLPGSVDGWSYALDRARAYFTAPAGRTISNEFVADAKQLGIVTRELHDALSSIDDDPDFAPEPITDEDIERWANQTRQSIQDATALLERALLDSTISRERAAEAKILIQRRDRYLALVDEIVADLGDDHGMLIRTHGDYHLGQVLRSPDRGFVVIDFEGEPTRSLAERRARTSALRDVAGMLRSFAYAAATLAASTEKTHDIGTRELRSARWERDVRAAFLDGYLGEGPPDGEIHEILPEERTHTLQLITLFETEKAFYELSYELNHRPGWVGIPMRGISKLLA